MSPPTSRGSLLVGFALGISLQSDSPPFAAERHANVARGGSLWTRHSNQVRPGRGGCALIHFSPAPAGAVHFLEALSRGWRLWQQTSAASPLNNRRREARRRCEPTPETVGTRQALRVAAPHLAFAKREMLVGCIRLQSQPDGTLRSLMPPAGSAPRWHDTCARLSPHMARA